MPRKIAVGPWIRPAFRVLRALRRLRGPPLDVFGYAEVRRVERSLPREYLRALHAALPALSSANYERVCELARAPEMVRGYESVKLGSVDRFRAMLSTVPTAMNEP